MATVKLHVGVANSECDNITKLYDTLGQNVCEALTGFHAFTGLTGNVGKICLLHVRLQKIEQSE